MRGKEKSTNSEISIMKVLYQSKNNNNENALLHNAGKAQLEDIN